MKDIKYYGQNDENVVDEKNEITSTSISYPNVEGNDNQYNTNNELRLRDNRQIDKSNSDKNDSNEMDNKKSSK